MRVEIRNEKVDERHTKTGKIVREQQAGLLRGADQYPLPFRIFLGDDPVHKAGIYEISPESFGLNQYGDLQLNRVRLIGPLPAAK